jgi:ribosomal protein L12E/L44/L45/RPP1/RPP2
MLGYKYPNIDSGATPIGSAGRAPDRKSISKNNSRKREEEEDEEEQEEILSI